MKDLTKLREGETATVTALLNNGSIKRRLQDLGLVEGTKVECIQKNSCGDLVAYGIRGAVIAIRSEDAREVIVDMPGGLERGRLI